jgi:hypothetical protein
MHNDYDILLHRQKHRHNDERGRLQRDDIGCRQKPGEQTMGKLERWVEAVSGAFNSQEVSNVDACDD